MSDPQYAEPYKTAIERLKSWTQGAMARDVAGRSLGNRNDPRAVCWCVMGAFPSGVTTTVTKLANEAGYRHAFEFNDDYDRTKAEVIALVHEAARIDGAVS